MVAISLYKGSLHKAPTGVPRRWHIPSPKISLKDFRVLLHRRAKALSRLQSLSEAIPTAPAAVPASSNLNDIASDNPVSRVDARIVLPQVEPLTDDKKKGEGKIEVGGHKATVVIKVADGVELPEKMVEGSDVVLETKVDVVKGEKSESPVNPSNEVCLYSSMHHTIMLCLYAKNKVDVASDIAERKKEVEEKLEVLNAKKHNLVQLLKQILSAEEALKGRKSLQGMAGRPPVPLQVDVTNDTGSMTRRNTPRIGSDGHSADVGGEGDDVSNNLHSRSSLRMISTSPSPDSQHRKSVHNTIPFSSRTTMAVTSSPSRFSSAGKQWIPSNTPSVSISATNYIASTPSPAAVASGGGTPAFGDA